MNKTNISYAFKNDDGKFYTARFASRTSDGYRCLWDEDPNCAAIIGNIEIAKVLAEVFFENEGVKVKLVKLRRTSIEEIQ